MPDVLLVIPAYCESKRLPVYLRELLPVLEKSEVSFLVQVIEDGSPGEEALILKRNCEQLMEQYRCFLPLVCLLSNQGKGAAVYEGWARNPGCHLLGFVDADGSIPPHEIPRLARLALESGTSVFGSRIRMLGKRVERSWPRHLLSRIFATLVGTLLVKEVYDSQCGLKFLPSKAYDEIKSRLSEKRFAFDLDLLLGLKGLRCPVREEPIDWIDCAGSKVCVHRDAYQMISSVIRLKSKWLVSRRKREG